MSNNNLIKGQTGDWEIVIGCEVHAQISTNSKLFSASSVAFGAEPNTQVSFIDSAMPGMLPTINEYAIEQAVRTGLAIDAQINKHSVFDRKNYFYADLPQGYQITQFLEPIVGLGKLDIKDSDGNPKTIGITRIHLEQDAGKSLHDQNPEFSYIDLNRSGVALMEIVSEPDISSSFEASEYIKNLRAILRYIGTCDADMDKGMMRCDANVSVRRAGETKLGTRCEIKNLNSIRNIVKAVDYEVERQIEILESGGEIEQQTRLFDSNEEVTKKMRGKEDAHDYRYFPDPDLLPVEIDDEFIDNIRKTLPELPNAKKLRYIKDYSLSEYDADVLTTEKRTADYFEEVVKSGRDAKLSSNWITAELFGRLNKADISFINNPVSVSDMSELIELIETDVISGKIAKDVFDKMFESGDKPSIIVEKEGLKQVTDTGAIEKIVDEVIAANGDKVEQYKSGKDKLFGFFVGQVMKLSQGKANPKAVNDILKDRL